MTPRLDRRQWLATIPALAVAGTAPAMQTDPLDIRYCLNTSTLQGQKLDLVQLADIAAKAGYQAIEPWISELEQYAKNGGDLREFGKRLHDQGLTVESAIGFPEWIVDDPQRRKKGLEDTRHCLELVQQVGGKRLAAPPAGATKQDDLNLHRAAERYREILELGDQYNVTPELEIWGFSRCLNRLGEAAMVAVESGHPKACILADVFHLYKGGSNLNGFRLLNGAALPVLHFNDYPDQPRDAITDAQRVYPGDGTAPLKTLLRELHQIGFKGCLSLELFNRDYWKQDPLTVARTGLEKMKAVVRNSLT